MGWTRRRIAGEGGMHDEIFPFRMQTTLFSSADFVSTFGSKIRVGGPVGYQCQDRGIYKRQIVRASNYRPSLITHTDQT